MKAKEIRELTEAEARAKLHDLRQELFHLRLQQQTARLERSSRIREVRREVARIETILNERRRQAGAVR
jgi:LSU ribosomal protein L29P